MLRSDDPRRSHRRPLTREQQREFLLLSVGSSIPLFCIPIIMWAVEDTLLSSILLSLATGTSTLIAALLDYIRFRIKGEWITPRLSTALITAGALAMLMQVAIYAAGVRGIYYIPLQLIVMVMFIHCGLREWKRWV